MRGVILILTLLVMATGCEWVGGAAVGTDTERAQFHQFITSEEYWCPELVCLRWQSAAPSGGYTYTAWCAEEPGNGATRGLKFGVVWDYKGKSVTPLLPSWLDTLATMNCDAVAPES